MIGCYPGSFNPPTVAHLAVAEAAVRAAGLTRLDLVVSRVALGKEDLPADTLAERVAVLEVVAATRPWLGVAVTDARLVTDIAREARDTPPRTALAAPGKSNGQVVSLTLADLETLLRPVSCE